MTPIQLFWYWVNERHHIYRHRAEGNPAPHTPDKILQTYKFTNPFRENDKTTVWFREHVRDRMQDTPEVIWATILFRWFNRIDVGEFLLGLDSYAFHPDMSMTRLETALREWRPKGPWVTGAYIIHTPTGVGLDKLAGVVADLRQVQMDWPNLLDRWAAFPTIERATQDLCRYRDIGPFMAYEVASDLRWTHALHPVDRLTWANPGPGAVRGLNRIAGGPLNGSIHKGGAMTRMRGLLARWRDGLGPRNGRRKAEMRDVEHSLCEFDKYSRVLNGEGRPREKWKG